MSMLEMQALMCPYSRRVYRSFLIFFLVLSIHTRAQSPASIVDSASRQQLSSPDTVLAEPQVPVKRRERSGLVRNTLYVSAAAGLWTGTYILVDEPLQQFTQAHRSEMTSGLSRIVEPLGRQKYWVPMAGLAFASGHLLKDQRLKKVGVIAFGSLLINGTITSTLKHSLGRHRPSETTENKLFDGPFRYTTNSSLPSSHTSTAFTVATSVATVYADYKFVPPLAYGLATLVGLSRVHDNAHWATDVLAGAAVGYLSSKGMNYLYNWTDHRLKAHQQKLLLVPHINQGSAGFCATVVF